MARRWQRAVLTALALLPLAVASAFAGPNGASVVGGTATVQGQGTANVTVTQTSPSAIINWQTFNIGSSETTSIYMPSSNSTQLDRVNGGQGPSQILGTLTSNGKVFLVNPDGILFGMGARINVGSLVATTNDIRNSDFMAGRYNFSIPGNPNASIVNLGTITAQTGGFAALVAPGVRNTGTITAKLGTIALASGNAFTLDMYGDDLITLGLTDKVASQVIDVATGKPLKSLVDNEGMLKANGGTVVLTAVGAREIVDSVINNSGVIEANTIGSHNGKIVLGGPAGTSKYARAGKPTIKVSGTLSATGKRKGTVGGTIQITGQNIQVAGAAINASGQAGGGTVLIGGDWAGGHPNTSLVAGNASASLQPYAVPNSNTVSIDAATMIDASATSAGNGGKVIVWANQATTFLGTVLANGGAQSGNGGLVETSGGTLTYNGTVNTSAPNGRTGTWLLDPTDLTINSSGAATISSGLASNNVVVYADANGNTSGQGTTSSGPGDIIVASAISWSSANTLTLDAYHDVKINNVTITNSGGGSLVLRADSTGTGAGTVSISGDHGTVNFSNSTGAVTIFYNPADNPQGSTVNPTSYTLPSSFHVQTNRSVPDQLTAYMLVNTVYDLQNVENNLSGSYALGTNIDAGATANWNGGAGFVPIGDSQNLFSGSLNGQGFTINNLMINSSAAYVGLFGAIGSGGSVQNLGIGNISLTASGWNGPHDWAHVGALAGSNEGTISKSYATGTITSSSPYNTAPDTGGLVGTNYGAISQSYASVNITESSTGGGLFVGGLVGWNIGGTVTQSYATGTVTNASAVGAEVGGLIGSNEGSVTQSYSTGAASGPGTVGGLIGYNDGPVTQSYSIGGASGPDIVGGLIGTNDGIVTQSYSIGGVNGAIPAATGGLIGVNDTGSVASSYWNTNTSLANGYGTNNGTFSGQGLTTAQFQSGLPSGFNATVWGSNLSHNGGFPYLLWSVPAGSQVIAGYVFNDAGITSAGGGIAISGLVNGTSVGSVTTGANGSYNIVLFPGTISASGSQVLAYTTGSNAGAAYMQNAIGSIQNLNIYIGYLNETSGAANLSSISAGLATAIGGNTSVQSLVNGLGNRTINATVANFTIDQPITSPNGALTLNASGGITATTAIDVGTFTLANGNWSQVDASLPGFSAQSFVIGSGSFLRASGGNGSSGSPYQITDVYGLQGIGSSATLLESNYVLANNIDASGTANWNGGAGFVPIGGNNSTSFTGMLNGNGNAISGLTINASAQTVVGLFGVVGTGGTVENVGLTGGSVSGGFTMGELVGLNGGAVTNSYATGIVNGSASGAIIGGLVGSNDGTVTGSYATGAVNGGDFAVVGGLAGLNFGAISQSHATGNVTAGATGIAGGLVGTNFYTDLEGTGIHASITDSYATGNVSAGNGSPISTTSTAGGLVGDNFGTVSQSYAIGAVTVGANGTGGGLVGQNSLSINDGQIGTASISNSYASGPVSSSGINVQLGGLAGQNDPGAQITNSQAYGKVTSTASLSPSNNNSDCSLTGTCLYVNVGGFVGANFGTITGTTWTTTPTSCAASFSCASGNVSVGSLGSGGGFVGYNEGIIKYAFATGAVIGAAGLPDTVAGNAFDNSTQIAGFVADNRGQIAHSFATGTVGTQGTMWLSAGGFAGDNKGTIDSSFAISTVLTGDNSTAGGFAVSNGPDTNTQTCTGCFTGDGFNNSAAISNSQASGNVTAGALSVAGGFAAIGGSDNHGQTGGGFTNISASGAVNAGHDSIIGGLVGILAEDATISNSSANNSLVASSGSNSIVGGIVGLNEGTISNTTSTAPVSGTSDSYIGGVTGVNLGQITGSSTDPDITGSGGNNFIGGVAGLNAGSINNSTANIALSTGPSSYAGGVAGVNGSYSNATTTITNSSYPNGTITNSSAAGTGFSSQTGTSTPAQSPNVPSWLAGCTDAVCAILVGGSLQSGGGGSPTTPSEPTNTPNLPTSPTEPTNTPNLPTSPTEPTNTPNSTPPTVPPTDTVANQQVTQFTQPINFTTTNVAPPLVDPASLASLNGSAPGNAGNPPGGGNGANGLNGNSTNGNTGTLANGRQGGNGAPPGVRLIDMPVLPLPPGTGVPPLGETRFLIDEVVLQFGPEVTPQQVTDVARRFNLTIVAQQTIAALRRTVYTFRINNGRSVAEVIRLVESAGLRVAAQPNYTYLFAQDQGGSAADLGDPAQYIVQKLQLGTVHRITEGKDVVIAVIDSQVDTKQPDFAGRIVESYDAGCGPNTPPDVHGTGMAGAIASHIGLLGVAPNARIIAICAFGGTGKPEATSAKIIRGVDYAIAHGAKIINMSFAGPRDPALAQELQIAREKGILIIAAAGNAGPKSPPLYPGADPNVMAVTATDEHDRLFIGANQGTYVAVAAPGVNILVPAPNGDVQFTTGTSVASANVSGVAALLMAEKPTRTPEEIRGILVDTARHLGAKGMNTQFGAGLVDPLKALHFVPPAIGRSSSAASPTKLH